MENRYEDYKSKYQQNINGSGELSSPYWMDVLEKMTCELDSKNTYNSCQEYKNKDSDRYYTPKK